MFTGIVREVGTVASFDGSRLVVETGIDAAIGDSVAISGVCLTVTAQENGTLAFDVVAETLARTTLGRLAAGSRVNIEPSLRAGDPLGGHIVQGHVDGVGSLRAISVATEGSPGPPTFFDAPPEITRYCVEKGSIAVDGTSLTVAAVDNEGFAVALIPHTLAATTLGSLEPGDPVNLEVDVLAKYVERLTTR
jgi:riboflavin synthase